LCAILDVRKLAKNFSIGDLAGKLMARDSDSTISSESGARLIGRVEDVGSMDPEAVFRLLLTEIWNRIAAPVIRALNLKVSVSKITLHTSLN
jgi:hypothetical protein